MSQFSYVQGAAATSGTTLAFGSPVTAGNILLAFATSYTGSIPAGLTDTQGNTWKRMWSTAGPTALYFTIAGSSGSNTVTFTGISGSLSIFVLEYSSSASFAISGGSTDVTPSGGSASTATTAIVSSDPAIILPPGVEYLAVSCVYDQHNAHSWTSSGATIRQQEVSIPGGQSAVIGDQDGSAGISLASPYANNYVGMTGYSTLVGGMLFLVALSSGVGGAAPVPVAEDLMGGVIGSSYSETIGAQGGTSPYTYAVTYGALPTGTSLDASTGVISGTPSAAGTFTFTITVTDTNGNTGSQPFSIAIAAPSGGGSYTFLC